VRLRAPRRSTVFGWPAATRPARNENRTGPQAVTARRRPWWLPLAVGLACIVLGGYLIAEPFRSLSALRLFVVFGLVAAAVSELLGASDASRPALARVSALALTVAALAVAALPGLTLLGVAIVAGVGLLLVGVADLRHAFVERGEERLLLGLKGGASVVCGVVALSWPSATVLVIALIVGARTFIFGCVQLASVVRPRPPRPRRARHAHAAAEAAAAAAARRGRTRRRLGVLGGVALAIAGVTASAIVHSPAAPRPGPFYAAPSPLPPGPPGTLIRTQEIKDFVPGAKAYRILYKSTGFDGRPDAVSGVVVVPEGPAPRGGRKVIAFTHGTVGVASDCAPSLQRANIAQVLEGLGEFVAAGYVVAATDYSGLGTAGPNPYLVGRVEAANALDSVRAAHRLRPAHAGVEYAVWGHSQGGQASLFTGQLAGSYAPDLHLVGVAAGAPAPDLIDLLKVNVKTTVGRVLIAMALSAWSKVYANAKLSQILTPAAIPTVEGIASACLYGREALAAIPGAGLLGVSFFRHAPWHRQPWRRIAIENSPGAAPIGVPVLITQGGADPIVPARVTQRLARKLCAAGERVDLRIYPSLEHLEAGIVVVPDVATWIAGRFQGREAPTTCR
jgi:uncharacterized membrane protein HdeD (DUF308 family)/alpha-beta hydrolase superfamily lysophospholipase